MDHLIVALSAITVMYLIICLRTQKDKVYRMFSLFCATLLLMFESLILGVIVQSDESATMLILVGSGIGCVCGFIAGKVSRKTIMEAKINKLPQELELV